MCSKFKLHHKYKKNQYEMPFDEKNKNIFFSLKYVKIENQ